MIGKLVRSTGYARMKVFNGALFAVAGIFIAGQSVAGYGIHGWQGIVLGLAMLALGVVRIRMGWPRRATRP